MRPDEDRDGHQRAAHVDRPGRNTATSRPPDPHGPATDRAPATPTPAEVDPTTEPTPPAAPARPPRRRRKGGDRRATIDTATQEAIQAAIGELVADAPPLSDETRERLAALLSTTSHRPNPTRRPGP